MRKRAPELCIYGLALILGFAGITPVFASQNFQSCSVIASELLTAAQLHYKGFKLTELYESLPGLTAKGKERLTETFQSIEQHGLVSAFSAINSRYARCAKQVFQITGKPSATSSESLFYFCSGENKLRYEFIVAFAGNVDVEQLAKKTPSARRQLVYYMWDIYSKNGLESVFDFSATELKRCITQ